MILPMRPGRTPRAWQLAAFRASCDGLRKHPSGIVQAATGVGKGDLLAAMAVIGRGRVLVNVHRQDLVNDLATRVRHLTDDVGVVMGAARQVDRKVVVGCTPSLHRRRDDLGSFSLLITDEAHMATSPTNRDLQRLAPLHLGFTATPFRSAGDGSTTGLGSVFRAIFYRYPIKDAIAAGDLCPIEGVAVKTKLSLESVATRNGDFILADLAPTVDVPARNNLIIDHYDGRPGLAFCAGVAHAQHLADAARARGYAAEAVWGDDPDRRAKLARFFAGTTTLLTSADLLLVGFDAPHVETILMARPTKSRVLWCLDARTEVLTPDGWRGPDDDVSTVAAFDVATGAIRWQAVTNRVDRPLMANERMYALESNSIDIRVSDRHRMVWGKRRRAAAAWMVSEAADLAQRSDDWILPVAGIQDAPGLPLTDDEIRFIGWILTDGCINRGNRAAVITQSDVHPSHLVAIESMLRGCGFKYRKAARPYPADHPWKQNGTRFLYAVSYGRPRGTDTHLRGWGALAPYIDKDFPASLDAMTRKQLLVLLEAMHLGNGAKQIGQSWTRRTYHIYTGHKAIADRLQSLCVRRGMRANVAVSRPGTMWVIHVHPHRSTRSVKGVAAAGQPGLRETATVPGERVWCVTNDLGTLITRRNGKVAIVGNCQAVGRGTRLHPGKDRCLLYDFADVGMDLCGLEDLSEDDTLPVERRLLPFPVGAEVERKADGAKGIVLAVELAHHVRWADGIESWHDRCELRRPSDIVEVDPKIIGVRRVALRLFDAAPEKWYDLGDGWFVHIRRKNKNVRGPFGWRSELVREVVYLRNVSGLWAVDDDGAEAVTNIDRALSEFNWSAPKERAAAPVSWKLPGLCRGEAYMVRAARRARATLQTMTPASVAHPPVDGPALVRPSSVVAAAEAGRPLPSLFGRTT